jgi:hypothetical protein
MENVYWVSGVHRFIESKNSVEISKITEGKISVESRRYEDLDLKIDIFENRTRQWFLNHAKHLSELEANPMNGDHTTPGDYAATMLACSQLEGFQKYREGIKGNKSSKYYFKKALKYIYFSESERKAANEEEVQQILNFLYEFLRSGSFHAGFPDGKIYLDRDSASLIDVVRTSDGKKIDYIIVNPVKFLDALFAYFHKYVFDLQNTDNRDLRVNFQKRWDCLWENS